MIEPLQPQPCAVLYGDADTVNRTVFTSLVFTSVRASSTWAALGALARPLPRKQS